MHSLVCQSPDFGSGDEARGEEEENNIAAFVLW